MHKRKRERFQFVVLKQMINLLKCDHSSLDLSIRLKFLVGNFFQTTL